MGEVSHGACCARATRIGPTARAPGAIANSSRRSSDTCARLIRRPARGAVRGPARAHTSLAGHPSHPLSPPAKARQAGTGLRRISQVSVFCHTVVSHGGSQSISEARRPREGRCVSRADLEHARGPARVREERAGIRPARVSERERVRAGPPPGRSELGSGSGAHSGGRETYRPARGPLPKRRDVEAGSPPLPPSLSGSVSLVQPVDDRLVLLVDDAALDLEGRGQLAPLDRQLRR